MQTTCNNQIYFMLNNQQPFQAHFFSLSPKCGTECTRNSICSIFKITSPHASQKGVLRFRLFDGSSSLMPQYKLLLGLFQAGLYQNSFSSIETSFCPQHEENQILILVQCLQRSILFHLAQSKSNLRVGHKSRRGAFFSRTSLFRICGNKLQHFSRQIRIHGLQAIDFSSQTKLVQMKH